MAGLARPYVWIDWALIELVLMPVLMQQAITANRIRLSVMTSPL